MAKLELKNISKQFNKLNILNDISLTIKDSEFVVLVGPSGSGKSTILRVISGLESPTSGSILIDDNDVTNLSPKDRDISMVFQNYALYPHLTIYQNLAFPLSVKNVDKSFIDKTVNETSELLGIKKYLNKKPKELSGGERQRVALGRAMVRNPKIFLMDEPLSNLDAKLRTQMRSELIKLHDSLNSTIVYVTHDQIEALTMGDKIVVLNSGNIQQVGSPEEIYSKPSNVFVAGFIGSPSMNFFSLNLKSKSEFIINDLNVSYSVPDEIYNLLSKNSCLNKNLIVGFRPEHITFKPLDHSFSLKLKIDLVEMFGADFIYHFSNDNKLSYPNQKSVSVRVFSGPSFVETGTLLDLYFDFSKAHFFDSNSGLRIL